MNPKVDKYFSNLDKWQQELEKLRMICLDCLLTEELKWGVPCYTYQGKNIVAINGLKENCSLGFFKGVLLHDEYGLLSKPGEHTQEGRYILFTKVEEITETEDILKAYIFEAVEVEKAGLKVNYKQTSDYDVPEEFQHKLDTIPTLKTAFEALTPGRQRAYLLHFSQPKQSKTREARIEKCIGLILCGKGLNDDYHPSKE